MELSSEAVVRIEEILKGYSETDEISDEIINKILFIVDVEIDTTQLATDIYEGGAGLADEFLNKIDDESIEINDEINSVL